MKALKALWRAVNAPESELWWSGLFFAQTLHLVCAYPQTERTIWDLATVLGCAILAIYSMVSGIRGIRKGRA